MVTDEFKRQVVQNNIDRAGRGVMRAVEALREVLDRIERDIKAGRKPTTSSTNQAAELFNQLGQYEAFLEARDILEAK